MSLEISSQPRLRASVAASNNTSVNWKISTKVTDSLSSGIQVRVAINQPACLRSSR